MMLHLVQSTLDALLSQDRVAVFFNRSKPVLPGMSQTEYVVYTQNGSPTILPADNLSLVVRPNITIRYVYDSALEDTAAGRSGIQSRAAAILSAMETAGFVSTTGILFLGDVDNVEKSMAVMELEGMEIAV